MPLPDPHPHRAVLSDLRVLDETLNKEACIQCGLVRRAGRTGSPDVYASGYSLYDHPPGAPREDVRQSAYADWIARAVRKAPARILDIGCGNGSLLPALKRRWPDAEVCGIDPSPESVACGRAAGLDVSCGDIDDGDLLPADLVVSVNVIEHVPDPAAFLLSASRQVSAGGQLIVICPNGDVPSFEILFADHVWSFGARHLVAFAAQAGTLRVTSVSVAPPAIGPFQMLSAAGRSSPTDWSDGRPAHVDAIVAGKKRYLEKWQELDDMLLTAAAGAGALSCFGIGEAAGLLRAYAPCTWSRVTVCLADAPERNVFHGIAVQDWSHAASSLPVLLGVRPSAQADIGARVVATGRRPIRWDHIITS